MPDIMLRNTVKPGVFPVNPVPAIECAAKHNAPNVPLVPFLQKMRQHPVLRVSNAIRVIIPIEREQIHQKRVDPVQGVRIQPFLVLDPIRYVCVVPQVSMVRTKERPVANHARKERTVVLREVLPPTKRVSIAQLVVITI